MHKSVAKIKDVKKVNKPNYNEKYKVWVVRCKTSVSWKAIWRKTKEDAQSVYEYLLKKIDTTKTVESDSYDKTSETEPQKVKTVKSGMLQKIWSKVGAEEKETVVERDK